MITKGKFIGQLPMLESAFLTKTIDVKLTWWERIKSLRPWIKYRVKTIPDDMVYEVLVKKDQFVLDGKESKLYIAHPQTIDKLRRESKDGNEG